MPLYHFKISNGHPYPEDRGFEFPDDEAAWHEALKTIRDVETSLDLDRSNNWSMEVRREESPIFKIQVTARRISQ
jgi:Domain of unknown function (DUF6894)